MHDAAPPRPIDDAEHSPLSGEDEGASVGDLVVLPVPRIRAQVGCGERVGVVLEDRRNVVKVLFPDIDRAFWIDYQHVLSIPEERLPAHPLAVRLHRLCRLLGVVTIEVYEREGDAEVFHLFTRGTTLEALDAARDFLG